MSKYIDVDVFIKSFREALPGLKAQVDPDLTPKAYAYLRGGEAIIEDLTKFPAADVVEVRHGRWILEAHDERVNYRWNVTAECSECCDEQKEIWAGFFRDVPSSIARSAALVSAESVKLSNYCPNCGAYMMGENNGKCE